MRYSDKVVLILDGDELIRSLLVDMLRPFQFAKIRKAATVADLGTLDNLSKVDLCLIDWTMPGVGGETFLHELRRDGYGIRSDVRTIMVIGSADREAVLGARDAGANAVIGRPFSKQMVANAVVRAMEDARPFIVSPVYVGPDRRVRRVAVPEDRREPMASSRSAA